MWKDYFEGRGVVVREGGREARFAHRGWEEG
jgi:hypothetical protein